METLGNGWLPQRLLLCCALWGLCLASSDYDGEYISLGGNLLLLQVLNAWYLYKTPENSLFHESTWENTLIELCAYSA